MGKSGGLSGGCGLPPQYRCGGEQQRPGQTESHCHIFGSV